ncbi:hypothetical protein EDWATA_00516 [Edwardsiella tarda ATCC 23685]|uniref:Uncharacterized protein n=1 Tax=Edwardsiella tarda ATCC 23685 TaxID=500638 RepID=D4F1D1_EDWTA|nr:hypothetical protein EDWATA_00516 [Edwardsiella tarda ATCC 23685]
MVENGAGDKKVEIKTCHLARSPYNAPPLTGNNDNNVAQSGRESKNKCLTLRAKSVIYAAHADDNLTSSRGDAL